MAVAQSGLTWGVQNPQKETRPARGGVVDTYAEKQAGRTISGQANDIRRPQAEPQYEDGLVYGRPAVVGQYADGPWGAVRRPTRVKHKSKTETAAYQAGKLWARTRVSAANTWIMSWAMFWYLTFQLPIALISAAGIGMAYAVYSVAESLVGETILQAVLSNGTRIITTAANAISNIAKALYGIDFDPLSFFVIPFTLVFLLGLFQLILTWFIYSLVGVKSLTGEHGGLKGVVFMVAGVGYAIPILNLFPLILLWMVIVWKYPK